MAISYKIPVKATKPSSTILCDYQVLTDQQLESMSGEALFDLLLQAANAFEDLKTLASASTNGSTPSNSYLPPKGKPQAAMRDFKLGK